jgi:heptaprenyl diphosphate synthase
MNALDSKDLSIFQAPVNRELLALEGDLKEALRSDLPLLQEIAAALTVAPGKRLRPNILFLASRCTGGLPEKAAAAALAVELIHTATLLHDDILDAHMTRRGRPTVFARWGADSAMIMGDYLFSKAFARLGEAKMDAAIEVLAKVTNLMSLGELIQLQTRKDIAVSEEDYMAMIYRKTASLFAAASECGALTGNGSERFRAEFVGFGENIGLAFQITDDLLDYLAADVQIGKPIASDFTEGRVTLPFISAFRNAPEESRKRVSELFHSSFNDEANWNEVVSFIQDFGGVEYSIKKACELSENAKKALGPVSSSLEKDAMCFAADYICHRTSPYTA